MRLETLVLLAMLGASGCAPKARTWSSLAVFQSLRTERARPARKALPAPAATLVERDLRRRGLRFGTDGSVGALYGYLRDNHAAVDPERARPGDVLFFDVANDGLGCGNHVGLVEEVDDRGRITFREIRDKATRVSFVHAGAPRARRDERGRVLNTFLRPKRPEDPAGTLYFAGEMLCAVVRPEKEP